MLRKLIAPALAATLVLAACDQSPTAPSAATADDYALVMFGEAGSSMEGTMGPQAGPRPFDGRSGTPELPDSLRLTQVQRDSIFALRSAFRAAHAAQIDSMQTIFRAAKAAREGGATRDEVRAILVTARPIALSMRPFVIALHLAVRAVLTDAQRAWIEAHRPRRFPTPMAGP